MPQVGNSPLVEPATTTQIGTVEKATTTEAKAGTADKFPDAAGVHAAFNQYGLGGSSGSLNDANDMVTPGTFGGPGASGVNFPDNTRYGMLRVSGRLSYIRFQEALYGSNEYYIRYTNDSGVNWTDWEQIYHTGMTPDFSNMPQVGGDPIVESGSNADGEWTRWSDGTQICYLRYSGTGRATNPLPISFFSPASVVVVTNQRGNSDETVAYDTNFPNPDKTVEISTIWRQSSGEIAGSGRSAQSIVTGRWK
jgi:hypothetical protein